MPDFPQLQPAPFQPGQGPLMPPGAPQAPAPPPAKPGTSIATSQPLQSDLNDFVRTLISSAGPPPLLSTARYQREADVTEEQYTKGSDALLKAQEELASRQKARADAEMTSLRPLFEQQKKSMEAAQGRIDEANAQLPEYTPQPVIDPQNAQDFMYGLLAVALVGGLAGKAGWMTVSQSMNGMLRGFVDGSKERAQESYNQFKRDYDQAMGKLKSAQQGMQGIIYATDVPINQILREAEIQAKVDGAEEKELMARQGHLDRLQNHHLAIERMIANLDQKNQTMQTQIDIALARFGKPQGNGGGQNLDDFGKWALAQIAAGGNAQPLTAATTRWASPQRAEIWNILGKEWYDKGVDPRNFNQAQVAQHVERAAQRWAKVRYEAVGQLEGRLTDLESPLMKAIKRVNGVSPQLLNQPINAVINRFGTGQDAKDLAYLRTLTVAAGRAYQEVTTMPASSAQMHWGAQEMAQEMINQNFTLAQAQGFYKAVKLEVQINTKNLNDMVRMSQKDLQETGITVGPPTGATPRIPRTPQEREALYGGSTP